MTGDDSLAGDVPSRRPWLPPPGPARCLVLFVVGIPVLLVVLVVVLVAVYVRPGSRGEVAEGGNMVPTVERDDHLMTVPDRRPHVGDIVTYRKPEEPGREFLSRVAAVGGQTISCPAEPGDPTHCRAVLVNGAPLADHLHLEGGSEQMAFPALAVPSGDVFLLGDNRNDSADSRLKGTTRVADVVGKVRLRYRPLSRFGSVG